MFDYGKYVKEYPDYDSYDYYLLTKDVLYFRESIDELIIWRYTPQGMQGWRPIYSGINEPRTEDYQFIKGAYNYCKRVGR